MTWRPLDSPAASADRTQELGGLIRPLRGLGGRLGWACDRLADADGEAEPVEGAWSIGEHLAHLAALVRRGRPALGDGTTDWAGNVEANRHPLACLASLSGLDATMQILRSDPGALSGAVLTASSPDHTLSPCYLVNGPWANAQHHVDQVVSLRKMPGHPAPHHQTFLGQPPLADCWSL
jgi:hypothetical protein